MRRLTIVLGLAALSACRGADNDSGAAGGEPVGSPASSASSVASPSAAGPAGRTGLSLRAHMDDHFDAAARLERALVRSDLARARVEAAYLIDHPEHAGLDDWTPYLEAMRASARQVKEAPDVAVAAGASALLGLQCSRCHADHSAVVTFGWEAAPPSDGTAVTRMRRHQWAAARMWEGLIGPSQTLWTEGADLLAGADLEAIVADRMVADHDARDLVARVRVLARRAPEADSAEARAALYGDLLASCAACHQLVRDPRPAPAP